MKCLTNREAQSLFNAVSALYSNQDTMSLPSRIFEAVRQVAPAEIYGINTFHPEGYWLDQTWQEPISTASVEDLQAFYQYANTHPLYDAFVKTGLPAPRKTSDFVTTRQFHRFAIYNEFYRKFGIDRQMVCGLSVSSTLTLMLTLNRQKKDFTESHRRQIAALRPHLIAAYQNAERFKHLQLQSAQLELALAESGCGAILIDAAGRVRLMTEQARLWLAKYFAAPHGCATSLPEELVSWLKHRVSNSRSGRQLAAAAPVPHLEMTLADGCLEIRFLNEKDTGYTLLLMEESVPISAKELERLGLTPREAEVLNWITQGKTNPEIAILCYASERTIHKHIEHIYRKLGVETRTAAARVALSVNGQGHSSLKEI
jgi:DNA-binding CsgD family transcriptional regulator